ncbi:MAG TPA: hypothetical protein VHF26_17345, partial [Trebonia sp.]|nr:hypothetical protein [Trebonia sp.]
MSETDDRGHSDAFEPEDAGGLGAGRAGGFPTDVAVAFEQGGVADTLAPGPALAGLTEAVVAALPRLTDDQLIGVIRASRRQQNREAWRQALMVAEFARRRADALRAA